MTIKTSSLFTGVIVSAIVAALLCVMAFVAFKKFLLPAMVDQQIEQVLSMQQTLADKATLEQALAAEQTIRATLENVQAIEVKAQSGAEQVEALIALAQRDIVGLDVQTGALVIDSNAFPALANPDGCQANRGIISRTITFERPFNSAPSVLPVFTQLDFNHDADSRLRIEVRDISPTGFTVDFATWCDTRISQAKASWIAVGV